MSSGFETLHGGFELDRRFFSWGITVAGLRSAFAKAPPRTTCEVASLRYPCAQAYGFPATAFYARGPAEDRPVLNLSIDLAPHSERYADISAAHWLDAIRAELGEPVRVSDCDALIARTLGPGNVVYSASWTCGGANLSFSLFGGFRTEEGSRSVAGLFIGWHDEAAAAQPFLAPGDERQQVLAAIAEQPMTFQTFDLGTPQRPFHGVANHFAAPPTQPDASRRRVQRALLKPGLQPTPAAWAARLQDTQVAFWYGAADGRHWGLCNRWDTVFFRMGDVVKSQWTNMLPAKGGGGMSLTLGDLEIQDKHDSLPLKHLVAALESFLGHAVHCGEIYDC